MESTTCKIPIRATFSIVNGEPVMTSAEYADVSADAIAKFLVDKLGIDAIFSEGAGA